MYRYRQSLRWGSSFFGKLCLSLLLLQAEPLPCFAEPLTLIEPSAPKAPVQTSPQLPQSSSNNLASRWRTALLPLIGYNVERGLGYGLYLSLFKKRDPSLVQSRGVRYDFSLTMILLQTFKDYNNHRLILDLPRLTDSGLRFQSSLRYELQYDGWYSGAGTPSALLEDQLDTPFYKHELRSIWLTSSLIQPLAIFHPALRVALGLTLRDVMTKMKDQSLIAQEQPVGFQGGLVSLAQLSVIWDTRDREPDTEQGIWGEVSLRSAHPLLLSDWSFAGFNATYRHYIKVLDRPTLVYAHRIGVDYQWGNVPYFQRSMMGGQQWTELGGNSVLRSYKFGRFRGDFSLYLSAELRVKLTRFHFRKRPIDIIATPLFDLGYFRGNDQAHAQAEPHWLWGSAGLGARVVYDEGVVIRVDLMWAYERLELESGLIQPKYQTGIFIMTDHSF